MTNSTLELSLSEVVVMQAALKKFMRDEEMKQIDRRVAEHLECKLDIVQYGMKVRVTIAEKINK